MKDSHGHHRCSDDFLFYFKKCEDERNTIGENI
jgi:hypothetical protein